jgi:hypothetical protein
LTKIPIFDIMTLEALERLSREPLQDPVKKRYGEKRKGSRGDNLFDPEGGEVGFQEKVFLHQTEASLPDTER